MPVKILLVAGARPNFMKVAPILRECEQCQGVQPILVHTGQHYDSDLSSVFFRDLGIRNPDHALNVGSGTHAEQTSEVLRRIEPVFLTERPDIVVVVGDVNSTMAAALVAVKLGLPVAHVEAGLRSFDRRMPEEVNRVVTDAISSLLFTTEASANENLQREGIPADRVFFVGNVMIDTLLAYRERAERSPVLEQLHLQNGNGAPLAYGVITLHRPSNVDEPSQLARLIRVLREISRDLPLIFPVHPRTSASLRSLGPDVGNHRLRLVEPMGYHSFIKLMAHARIIITDSGGIQEEATILGVPCLTARDTTERPVTVESGWNRIVGADPGALLAACREALCQDRPSGQCPPLWDGKASQRILDVLLAQIPRISSGTSVNPRAQEHIDIPAHPELKKI